MIGAAMPFYAFLEWRETCVITEARPKKSLPPPPPSSSHAELEQLVVFVARGAISVSAT